MDATRSEGLPDVVRGAFEATVATRWPMARAGNGGPPWGSPCCPTAWTALPGHSRHRPTWPGSLPAAWLALPFAHK